MLEPAAMTAPPVTPGAAVVATLTDALFKSVNARLTSLDKERDGLAIKIKDELYAAENWGTPCPARKGRPPPARPSSARQGTWRCPPNRLVGSHPRRGWRRMGE
jgi:hypothetical protein